MELTREPDLEQGVYVVTHSLQVGNARYLCVSDLVFHEDGPVMVFEWHDASGKQPLLSLPLDPELLEEDEGYEGFFVYYGQLDDPRTIH